MNENGSMPTPRYIDVEAFKVSYKTAIYAGLEALKDKPIDTAKSIAVMHVVFEALDAFPTAKLDSPRPDWTPCAEGLPEDGVEAGVEEIRCLATWITPYLKEEWVDRVKRVYTEKYGWYWLDPWGSVIDTVLAWQPLPSPYNPDRKDDAKADDVSQWPEWKQRAALSNYELGKED